MGPKKSTKMSLTAFLGDEAFGATNWADEVDDLPALPQERSAGGFRDSGYSDNAGGYESGGMGRRSSGYDREPVPLPTEPPFTAHVGNLSFDLSEGEITNFFGGSVSNVRLVVDPVSQRSRGFAYVEFQSVDALKSALDLSGEQLLGRPVRVTVAEPRRSNFQDDRSAGDWVRRGPLPPVEREQRSFGGYRNAAPRQNREEDAQPWVRRGPLPSRENAGRPRLNLKPRTSEGAAASAASSASKSKFDPFGGAKPVDNAELLLKVEEKIAKRNQAFHQEVAPAKPKAAPVDKTAEKLAELRLHPKEESKPAEEAQEAAAPAPAVEEEEEGWTTISKGRK
ncbi:transaltion initiation factor [Schizosaccharomyces japonicus yFS275]|uniref:Transaltion initiation factor n=1 Tax=Schizosaccharomyces japonicus (strain yFS275 / FY16936) TaxID=402676 RepID=B6K480_SCHJY|nr:transaltion initiation factor [Schizosaccharomyces japonicus yFS275]EEB08287.2 transaltion initiation factor [Schizosaccharomyces japonicus yFS275]